MGFPVQNEVALLLYRHLVDPEGRDSRISTTVRSPTARRNSKGGWPINMDAQITSVFAAAALAQGARCAA